MQWLAQDGISSTLNLVNQFGPVAFGLIAVLVIWQFIFKPFLAENRIDTEALKTITLTAKETAVLLNSVSQNLDRTADRLERLEQKWLEESNAQDKRE